MNVAVHVARPQQMHDGAAAPGADRQFHAAVADDPHPGHGVAGPEGDLAWSELADLQHPRQRGDVLGTQRRRRAAAHAASHPGRLPDPRFFFGPVPGKEPL